MFEHLVEFASVGAEDRVVASAHDSLLIFPSPEASEVLGVLPVAQQDVPRTGFDLGDGDLRELMPFLGEFILSTGLHMPITRCVDSHAQDPSVR